ncbi:unnamed protein product (macronuclear) [Paramecium tetraurelia]|uniref:VWFA domain-containing protein n=1 Tax=Paramecium tetraurelia TaxID=5888 RepID=A0D8L3_PARTE|nr:uncharacterized protein GSPATT00014326001 [Paramecium tetraurelia]CAK79380.1 unnamed protein product [Paramecium tetraurelia]|eukprot:XP_001446777.1 hypothetical protein (macronuclear) [Paramecium tetraurelia strain d4-2]
MSDIIALSDYKLNKELNYLIKDKQENYFSNENCFTKLIDNFLDKLKDDERKQTIGKLDQLFPELKLQNTVGQPQIYSSICESPLKSERSQSRINFSTPQQKNIRNQDFSFYEELDNVARSQDWVQLQQMMSQNNFYMDGKYPNNFFRLIPLVEKLKEKAFMLIDLADYFIDCQFQLNLSILKKLLFYFYMPNDLNLTQGESQEIEQLLGELISQSWVQFEYHQNQLIQNNENKSQLEVLKVIPNMLTQTPQKQREIIDDEVRKILNAQHMISQQGDLEFYISKEMPILFEVQKIYYQICFYFLSVYHQQYKNNVRFCENERNRLLNSYIEEKTQQNSQKQAFQDSQFCDNQLEKFFVNYQVQQSMSKIAGKGIIFKSNEDLLQYFIDTNFYYSNKQQHIVDIRQQNKRFAKILNLLTEINDEDKRKIATIIKKVIQDSQDIFEILDDIYELKYQYDEEQVEVIFRIICEMLNKTFEEFWIYRYALNKSFKKKHIPNLKKIQNIKEKMKIQEMVQIVKTFDREFWEIMQKKFLKYYCTILNSLIQHTMSNQSGNPKEVIQILRDQFLQNRMLQQQIQNAQLFYHLLQRLKDEQVCSLFIENQKQNISLQPYLLSVDILFQVFCFLSNDTDQQQFKNSLEQGFKQFTSYHLNFLIEQAQNKISKNVLDQIYTLVYYWTFKKNNNLEQEAKSFFLNDPQLYKKTFSKLNFFDNQVLAADNLEYMEKKKQYDIYPRGLQISVDEFNLTLVELSQQDQYQLVHVWVLDIKNNKKFKSLLPFYLNIIKRGESPTIFLNMINQLIQTQQEQSIKYGYFNFKSMFQLLYNNSNAELQCLLLKQISQNYPVPFLYKVPYDDQTKKIEHFFLNLNIFYIHQMSFTIINLSLQQIQQRIGKTQLINKIFYQQDKFEILDNNKLNNCSIDIMYDSEFQGTRYLSIADVHNFIPLEILDEILPLFKLWIIQLDTEQEIESTISILEQLKSFQLKNKTVCFLIRDSSLQLESAQVIKLKQLNIEYKQVVNLTDNNLNKYIIDNEIKQVSQFLYDLIEKNENDNTIDANQCFNVISKIKNQNLQYTQEIGSTWQILSQIEQNLVKINQSEAPFLQSFGFLLQQQNFFILHLKFKDILQQFNQSNSQEKRITIGKLMDKISQIQQMDPGHQIQSLMYQKLEELILKGEPFQLIDSQIQFDYSKNILKKLKDQGETIFISILGSGSGNSNILNKIFGSPVQRYSNVNTEGYYFQLFNIYNKSIFGDLFKQVIVLDTEILQDHNQDNQVLDKKIILFVLSISDIIIINTEVDIKTEFKQLVETSIYNMAKLVNTPKQITWCFHLNNNNLERNSEIILNHLQIIEQDLKQEFIYQVDEEKAQYYEDIFDVNQYKTVQGYMQIEYFWKQNKNLDMKYNWRQIIKNDDFFNDAINYGIQNIQAFIKKRQNSSQSIGQQLQNIDQIYEEIIKMEELSELKKLKQFQQNDFMLQQYEEIVSNINFPNDDQIIESIDLSLNQNKHILSIELVNTIYNEQFENVKFYDQIQLEVNEKLKSIQDDNNISLKISSKYQKMITENINQKKQQTINIINSKLQHLDQFQQIREIQQESLMRDKFNQIVSGQVFPEKSEFIANIQQQIQENNQEITTEKVELIKTEQIEYLGQIFDQKEKELKQQISLLQRENNIKEEIIQKYEVKIQEQKHVELQACSLAISSETKNIQVNLSKTQEQKLYQVKIKEVQQNPDMIKELMENPDKLKAVYNQVQNEAKLKKEKQDETLLKDRCNEFFNIIQSQIKGSSLQSTSQENYKQAFLEKLIKDQPKQQDHVVQYNILQPELQQLQFKVLEKTDKKQYLEIFTQNIKNKLASSADKPILHLNKFYVKIIKCIKKQNIDNYMKNGEMMTDFESEIKNNDKQLIQSFLAKFTVFDFEIIDQNVDQLCQAIQNGIQGQQKQQSLLQCLKSIQKQDTLNILNEDSINKIQKNCQQLNKVLSQFEQIQINNNSEIDKQKIQENYLIETKPQLQKKLSRIEIDIFNYIMNQPQDLETKFNQNIVKKITELMNDEQQKGWNMLYEQIFQMVYDDMLVKNTVTASQENFAGLIKRLQQRLEIQIKDFNKQFSLFGVLLNEIGEKCIYNYAMFMIWRIVCFKYWEQKKKNDENEQQELEKDLFIKFKADLLQNRQEQSEIRGKQQATEIIKLQYQRLYQSYETEVKGLISNYDKETSFDLIKRLDKEILERQNSSITNSQLLQYIRNHADYIESYVKYNLNTIKTEIQSQLTKKLIDDMKSFLKRIFQNTKKLNDFNQNLSAKDYFVKLKNLDEAPSLLYTAVFGCMQGALDQNIINIIKPDMIQGFQIQGCYKFPFTLKNNLQNKFDEEIQILYYFMQSFNKKIQEEMKQLDQLKIDFEKLDVQSHLDALQVKQIGCQESCPICKRKCDLELDRNHKHQCRSGHQLRGMSGVLIGVNPSLFTCEEIQDYCKMQVMETKSIKYWGDIKEIYNDWLFSCIDVAEKKASLKKKFTDIWNLHVGEMICKQLTQEIGQEIQFIKQEDFDKEQLQRAPKAIHYVIMLDDSGSMQGEKFDNAKAGIIAFLAEIHKMKNKDSRVTIIIFNDLARVVVDSEVIDSKEQEQKITFKGLGTNFDEPFTKAYEKIIQRPDFDKFHQHSMFFYTDGQADYPQTALGLFDQLSPEQKQKIELVACTEQKYKLEALQKVVGYFKEKNFAYAELKHSIEPGQIGSTWIETISQKTHQLQKLG